MRVLFLSHDPHEAHAAFARAVGARMRRIPFAPFLRSAKRWRILIHFYPFLALLYSFFLKVEEDVLLVDGGSSLYLAVFLKLRRPHTKLVYIDDDLHLYHLERKGVSSFDRFFLRRVDAAVSGSEQNAVVARRLLDVPVDVCHPFGKAVSRRDVDREQAGLFVGRLDPDKDVISIIKSGIACPHFRKFYVVGDGPLRKRVVRLARKHRKLEFVGPVKDVGYWFSKCSFLLHTPSQEPFGVTPFEALRCGCYPLVSEGVGAASLLDPLFVLERTSAREVSRRADRILKDPTPARKAAKASLKNAPSREASSERFKEVFSRLVREVSS